MRLDPAAIPVDGGKLGAGPAAPTLMVSKQEAFDGQALAGEPSGEAEIYLVIFGMVHARVERPNYPVTAGAHQHGLLLHEVLLEHARKDLVIVHLRHRHVAPLPDATIRIAVDDRAAGVDEARLGMSLENGEMPFEVSRQGDIVVVEDPEIRSAYPRHRPVEGIRLADVLLLDYLDALAVASQDFGRPVCRTVIDHDDLSGRHGLP